MMFDGAAAPLIGRIVLGRRCQAELRRQAQSAPRLEQSEHVQLVTPVGASVTSNSVLPQWQLPLIATLRSLPNWPDDKTYTVSLLPTLWQQQGAKKELGKIPALQNCLIITRL